MRRVDRVLDRWPGEGYRYFRVRTADGDVCILRHDEQRDCWLIHYFEDRNFEHRDFEHRGASDPVRR